jgi:hypothetical protein
MMTALQKLGKQSTNQVANNLEARFSYQMNNLCNLPKILSQKQAMPYITDSSSDVQRSDTGQGISDIFEAQQRIPEAKHNKTVCILTNTTSL